MSSAPEDGWVTAMGSLKVRFVEPLPYAMNGHERMQVLLSLTQTALAGFCHRAAEPRTPSGHLADIGVRAAQEARAALEECERIHEAEMAHRAAQRCERDPDEPKQL